MGLETGNVIGDLNPLNPLGSDPKSTSDDHHRLTKKALRQSFAGFTGAVVVTGTDTGSINTYVLTPETPLLAYGQNMIVLLKPASSNTGASTLNISGLGATAILGAGGSPLIAAELTAGIESVLVYNGTSFQLANVSKAYVDNLSFAGSMPSTPLDGAVVRSVDGITQWAYVTPTLPLGEQIAAGQLVARDQNGNSVAVRTLSEIVPLSAGVSTSETMQIANGNLVHCYTEGSPFPGKFSILNTAGTILYGPITIASVVTGLRCLPLKNGNILFSWLESGVAIKYAIYSNTGSVVLAATSITSAGVFNNSVIELSNETIAFGTKNGSAYPTFIVYSQAGASVVAETVVESVATLGTYCKVFALSTGHILIGYVNNSGNLRFAKYTNAGASVIAATTVATSLASAYNFHACEQVGGNISFVYEGTSSYPRYSIVSPTFSSVYASTIIETTAITGADYFDLCIVPLTGGSCAVMWKTSTSPRINVRDTNGAETYASFSPSSKTGVTTPAISKTFGTSSNGFYFSFNDTYPTFMGAFRNNYISGISSGYSTTKQLINTYGEYNIGTSVIDALEKSVNYAKVGSRLIF